MAKYSKEELQALGAKLEAVQFTAREREILRRIFAAVSGGETGGFGGDEISDSALDAVVGGATFGNLLSTLDLGTSWTRGTLETSNSQYSDSPWKNSAAVGY